KVLLRVLSGIGRRLYRHILPFHRCIVPFVFFTGSHQEERWNIWMPGPVCFAYSRAVHLCSLLWIMPTSYNVRVLHISYHGTRSKPFTVDCKHLICGVSQVLSG